MEVCEVLKSGEVLPVCPKEAAGATNQYANRNMQMTTARPHLCFFKSFTGLRAADNDPAITFPHSFQNDFDITLTLKTGKFFSPLYQENTVVRD